MVWELQGLARPWEAWDAQRYPAMCQQKFSQNKGLPRTCRSSGCYSNRHRSKKWSGSCKALRGPGRPGTPRDIQGCASKNSHGTRGCCAHVEAFGCCNNRQGLLEALRPLRMAPLRGLRNGLGELQGFGRGLGGLGGPGRPCEGWAVVKDPELSMLSAPAKLLGLGSIPLHLRPWWRQSPSFTWAP